MFIKMEQEKIYHYLIDSRLLHKEVLCEVENRDNIYFF
jgi:hypothetical protein